MSVGVLVVPVAAAELELASLLREAVPQRFPFKVRVLVPLVKEQLPLELYDSGRMQYDASRVNVFLFERYRLLIEEGFYVVGLVAADGFVEGLNFVFGLASPALRTASVYLARLRSGGLELFFERVVKVVVHELGHLFGLEHCVNPSCVMRFSNSLTELDEKGSEFCGECLEKLAKLYESGFIARIDSD